METALVVHQAGTTPPLPAVKSKRWPRNPIDHFILARLEKESLKPSPEADKATLIRRVTFDLTGLPPTPAEVDAFLADHSPDAYERLVDRLLHRRATASTWRATGSTWRATATRTGCTSTTSGRCGRIAIGSSARSIATCRSINSPSSNSRAICCRTRRRIRQIATGFNRCNVTTSEGGSIDDEVLCALRRGPHRDDGRRSGWGLTVGCAVCHDHKFDPISQKEFYQLYAFFNNFNEKAMDGNACCRRRR